MRIIYFSTGFFEYVTELANAVAEEDDCEVWIFFPETINAEILELVSPRITVHLFKNVLFKSLRQNFKWLVTVRSLLKAVKPDIVHVQAYGHRWFHLLYLSWPKYRVYNTIHDPSPHSGDEISLKSLAGMKACLRWLPRYTSGVFLHGAILKQELRNARFYSQKPICVIPHGEFSIYDRFSKANVTLDLPGRYILFFGRIWRYKGLDVFLESAKAVLKHHGEQKFIVAGRGEEMGQYMKQVESVRDHFIFLNYKIPHAEVATLFSNCLFAVLPYKDATQSGVIPLAFAFSKTVIASNVGALSDVINDRENGVLVPPNDPVTLASAMLELIRSDQLRVKLEAGARRMAFNDMSWRGIAKSTVSFYRETKKRK